MRKSESIKQTVRRQGAAPVSATEQMNRAVDQVVLALRKGQPARLPGLGTITPGKHWIFRQEPDER